MSAAKFTFLILMLLASPLVLAKGLFQANGQISEVRKKGDEITFRFVGRVSFPYLKLPPGPTDVLISVGDWTRKYASEERDEAPQIESVYSTLSAFVNSEEGVRISLDNPAFSFANSGQLARISGTYVYAVPGFTAAERAAAKPLTEIRQRAPLTGDESREVVMGAALFPPGAATGRHSHPGDEYATVLEGALEIIVGGQPVRHVNAGESYHNARNVVHETRSVGDEEARVISTFIIDKGQPILIPAAPGEPRTGGS